MASPVLLLYEMGLLSFMVELLGECLALGFTLLGLLAMGTWLLKVNTLPLYCITCVFAYIRFMTSGFTSHR